MDFAKKHAWGFVSVAAFAAVFLLLLKIEFLPSGLTTPDDGYYHVSHSLSYCGGAGISPPVYTTLASLPSDLYLGYHAAMCPFLRAYPGSGPESWVAGAKAFTAALSLAFLLSVYFAARSLLRSREAAARFATPAALAISLWTLAASDSFFARLIFNRPHVIASIATVLAIHFTLKRRPLPLFIVGAALSLSYSVSFMALIPPAIYLLASLAYRGRSELRSAATPLVATFAGVLFGALIHPGAASYAFNGWYLHIWSIANRLSGDPISVSDELGSPGLEFARGFSWLAPLAAVALHSLWRAAKARSLRKALPLDAFFLLMGSVALTAGFAFVVRFAEYLFPFLALLFASWIGLAVEAARTPREARRPFPYLTAAKVIGAVFAFTVILRFGWMYANVALSLESRMPLDYYRGAAAFLAERAGPGEIVFLRAYDQYPRLAFFNGKSRYAIGTDLVFTYAYDPELYWTYRHAVEGGPICPVRACEEPGMPLRDAVARFGARYVFAAPADPLPWGPEPDASFMDRLARDPDFALAFRDPNYPEIAVYEAKPRP